MSRSGVGAGLALTVVVFIALAAPPGATPTVTAHAGHRHAAPPVDFAGTFDQKTARRAAKDVVAPVVSHRSGGRVTTGPRLKAIAHYSGFDSWEPTIGVTGKNELFFPTNIDVCCATSQVVRSFDRGKTWDAVNPKLPGGENAHFVSFDPYIYVDPDTDRVFTVDLTMACSTVSFSDDAGDTWATNPLGCGLPVNDHQTLFAGPPATSEIQSYPNVVYYCYNNLVVLAAFCSKSLDGGQTFVGGGTKAFGKVDPSSTDSGVPFVCGGTTGHGAVGPDGAVYLPRVECGQPWLAISRDEGMTWETVRVADNGGLGHEAGVAADAKGNLYFAWTSDVDHLPYLAISKDGGKTWSDPMMIGAPGLKQGVLPGLAIGKKPGHVAVVYMGTDQTSDTPRWNGYVVTSKKVLAADPVFSTAVIGDDRDPLTKAECLHRCVDAGDFFDVVIGSDGTVWAALVDACITKECAAAQDQINDGSEQGVVLELKP